jgi:hypothetical protein
MSIFLGGGDAVARDGLEIPTHDYIANTYYRHQSDANRI